MIKLNLTAAILLTAAALAGCGASASAAGNAAATKDTSAAAEAGTAVQDTAPAEDQRLTVTGELNKLPKEKADWKGLTYEEKLDDFDYLYKTLKENYPYLELIKRAKGVDMDQEYETCRAKVDSTETDMQFFVLVQKFISKSHGLGHLDLLTPGFYDWMVDAYQHTDGIPEEDIPKTKLLENEYANQTSAATYSAISDVFQETMDRVDAHNAALKETSEETAQSQEAPTSDFLDSRLTRAGETDNLKYGILSAENPSIAYIQIKSFDMSYYDEDKKTLDSLYREYADFDHVIFDLTENGGGGMTYFNDLMAAPNIDKTLSTKEKGIKKKFKIMQICITDRVKVNV